VTRVLVIGYGNPLRSDDGVGWRIAEGLRQEWGDSISVLTGQHLVPEWASELAAADVVFLVDASVSSRGPLRLRRITPSDARTPLLDGHTLAPLDLVRLATEVYGHQPVMYLLSVPAEDFAFGESLSPLAQSRAAGAVKLLNRRLAGLLQSQRRVG